MSVVTDGCGTRVVSDRTLAETRNEALEEAARVCDALDDDGYSESWRSCARAAGERIPVLKLQESGK